MIIFSLYTVGLLGAVIAFILNNNFKLGIVVGSALPSLIFALAVVLLEKYLSIRFVEEAPVIFYGAAFIGMASHKILSSYFLIGIAGLLFTFIYLHTSPYFDGFGGALGTTAALCFLPVWATRSEEHTSELQSRPHLVCRLLLEKKNKKHYHIIE